MSIDHMLCFSRRLGETHRFIGVLDNSRLKLRQRNPGNLLPFKSRRRCRTSLCCWMSRLSYTRKDASAPTIIDMSTLSGFKYTISPHLSER